MTLSELSLRNAKRQAKDYLVYFVTVVMAAALLYAFNALAFSPGVRELSSRMASLNVTIPLASAVVVCIFGWLVSYTTRFMLSRRSRELGTYLLIGLENGQVARLFLLENLAAGAAALVLGLALGDLLFQLLWAVVLSLFGKPYRLSFALSPAAAGLTLVYFLLIYLFAQLRCRRRIRRMKICGLMALDRQNEEAVLQSGRGRRRLFTVSILLGVLGTLLLMVGDLVPGIVGTALVIAFLYGFFASFSSGVPAYFARHEAKKYRGQTLLVFRTLSAKLSTMGVVMATVSMLFTATLIAEGSGMIFQRLFENRAERNACFDFLASTGDPEKPEFTGFVDYVKSALPLRASREYPLYRAETAAVTDYVSENSEYYTYYDTDILMRWSDYMALREMLGYAPVTLEPDRYLIHCEPYVAAALRNWNQSLILGGQELAPGGLHTELLAQYLYNVNGQGFLLVVPDEAAEARPVSHTIFAVLTEDPVTETQYEELCTQLRNMGPMGSGAMSLGDFDLLLYCKTADLAEAASMTALVVFPLFYLAMALTMTAAAILTVQQLSETDRLRRQFELLRKLGMDRQDMERTLTRQLAIYYALPALPPVLVAVPFLLHMGGLAEPGIMTGASHPLVIAAETLALFFLIYGVYVLLAYASLRRNVLPEWE
ncbi:FtsX-like permease family protein [uncultured Oscillibacter sp.]|uniref:FtsX-like permease family protein n=1 Tax=uncultured Oscillibacter sp. TaxID=876091 RepID=UPI00260610F8|nr:FtsX-like permease family protein [uncultured Oscillibacter sp.]